MQTISVSTANEEDRREWENYVARRKIDNHSFSWAWRDIIAQAFGHKPYYLIARTASSQQLRDTNGSAQRNEVVGICPLFCVRSLLFGKSLVSVPYLNGGGVEADSKQATEALLEKASSVGQELRVERIELRQRNPVPLLAEAGLHERTHKAAMVLKLEENPEALFSSFPPKLRSQIRRPSKSGIYAEISDYGNASDGHLLNAFFAVFAENMRDLGTPVYPRQLFEAARTGFGSACRVIVVWFEGKPVAAGITIGQGNTAEIPWASSLRRVNKLAPNMLLYWTAIKKACEDGYAYFDFGRSSPESSTFKFKEQWGAKPLPLHWYYRLFIGEMPNVSPQNPKYSLLVNCWKRLPLAVANTLGAWITRSIP